MNTFLFWFYMIVVCAIMYISGLARGYGWCEQKSGATKWTIYRDISWIGLIVGIVLLVWYGLLVHK